VKSTAAKGEKSLASLTFLVSLVVLVAAALSSGDAATSSTAAWLQTAPISSAWSEPAAPAIAPSYPETRDRVSGKSEPPRDQVSDALSHTMRWGYEQPSGWEAVGSLDAPGRGAPANDVVLGLRETLRSTERHTGGHAYLNWKKAGLTDVDAALADTPEAFAHLFEQATGRAGRIHFSLDRLNLRKAGLQVKKPLTFDKPSNVTAWELAQVLRNPKTIFYQNQKVVPLARVLRRLGIE
jgi:hypothetical protein